MGVTPAVLSTRAARATMSRLERVSNDGERWDAHLPRWRGVWIGRSTACTRPGRLEGLMDEVHFADPHVLTVRRRSAGGRVEVQGRAAMARAFAGKKGSGASVGDDAPVFAVLQSIGGSDAMEGSHRALPTPRRRMKGFRATRIERVKVRSKVKAWVIIRTKALFGERNARFGALTDETFSSSHSPTLSLLDEAVLFIFLVPSRCLSIATMLLRTGVDVDDSHGDA